MTNDINRTKRKIFFAFISLEKVAINRCSWKYFNTSKLRYNTVKYPWKMSMKEVYNRKANIVNIFLISSFFSLSLHYYPYLFIFFLISSFFPYLFIFFLISSFFSLSLHYFEYMSHLLLLYTPGENRVETFAIFNNVFFSIRGHRHWRFTGH